MCPHCIREDHAACIDGDVTSCTCLCRAAVDCDTCGKDVILWADDEDSDGPSRGECCTWGYVDALGECYRLDLSEH